MNSSISGVIWITGYSAAGKTTVARKLVAQLRAKGVHTLYFDGDDLRSLFGGDWGYSREDRVDLGKIYFRFCNYLASQGATVVISAVAMYDEVRSWVKAHVSNSYEVYLKVPREIRVDRDGRTKKIYRRSGDLDAGYREPTNPDMVVENHGEYGPEKAAKDIASFYLAATRASKPSLFAEASRISLGRFVSQFDLGATPLFIGASEMSDSKVLEIGVGLPSPLDAEFREKNAVNSIDLLGKLDGVQNDADCHPLRVLQRMPSDSYDLVMASYVSHLVSAEEDLALIGELARIVAPGGRLCVFGRSIADMSSRRGHVLSPTERVQDEYWRFIILDELLSHFTAFGLQVCDAFELARPSEAFRGDVVEIAISARRPSL